MMNTSVFVTVGTSSFDALVRAIDDVCAVNGSLRVFGQIGNSNFEPQHFSYDRFIGRESFENRISGADLVICHAGAGAISQILKRGKPAILVPRTGKTRDPRSQGDQLSFAHEVSAKYGIPMCLDPNMVGKYIGEYNDTSHGSELMSVEYDIPKSSVPEAIIEFLKRC